MFSNICTKYLSAGISGQVPLCLHGASDTFCCRGCFGLTESRPFAQRFRPRLSGRKLPRDVSEYKTPHLPSF